MSLNSNISWVKEVLRPEEIKGKRILDIGSKNWDETIHSYIHQNNPSKYIGIDILPGIEVDVIMDVSEIVDRFGPCSFDVILSLESLEHIENWPLAISNMKRVVRPLGSIVLTTRSYGYPLHGFPEDYWRFEESDLRAIFDDFHITNSFNDTENYGSFIKAIKPKAEFPDLKSLEIFSMKKNTRTKYQT